MRSHLAVFVGAAMAVAASGPAWATPDYAYANLHFQNFTLSGLVNSDGVRAAGVSNFSASITAPDAASYPGALTASNTASGTALNGLDPSQATSGPGAFPAENAFFQALTPAGSAAPAGARGDAQTTGSLQINQTSNLVSEAKLLVPGSAAASSGGTVTLNVDTSAATTIDLTFLASNSLAAQVASTGDAATASTYAEFRVFNFDEGLLPADHRQHQRRELVQRHHANVPQYLRDRDQFGFTERSGGRFNRVFLLDDLAAQPVLRHHLLRRNQGVGSKPGRPGARLHGHAGNRPRGARFRPTTQAARSLGERRLPPARTAGIVIGPTSSRRRDAWRPTTSITRADPGRPRGSALRGGPDAGPDATPVRPSRALTRPLLPGLARPAPAVPPSAFGLVPRRLGARADRETIHEPDQPARPRRRVAAPLFQNLDLTIHRTTASASSPATARARPRCCAASPASSSPAPATSPAAAACASAMSSRTCPPTCST